MPSGMMLFCPFINFVFFVYTPAPRPPPLALAAPLGTFPAQDSKPSMGQFSNRGHCKSPTEETSL